MSELLPFKIGEHAIVAVGPGDYAVGTRVIVIEVINPALLDKYQYRIEPVSGPVREIGYAKHLALRRPPKPPECYNLTTWDKCNWVPKEYRSKYPKGVPA